MKPVALALSALVLISCADSGPTDEVRPSVEKVRSYSEAPKGKFSAMGNEVDEVGSRFQIGCKVPGKNSPVDLAFDPRYRVGLRSVMRWDYSARGAGNFGVTFYETATGVAQDSVTMKVLFADSTDQKIVADATSRDTTCTLKRQQSPGEEITEYGCDFSPMVQFPTSDQTCFIERAQTRSHTETPGTFELVSDQIVPSVRIVDRDQGDIVCYSKPGSPKENRGPGTLVRISIVTNEQTGSALLHCGGSAAFQYESLTLTTGEVLSSFRTETLEIPTGI